MKHCYYFLVFCFSILLLSVTAGSAQVPEEEFNKYSTEYPSNNAIVLKKREVVTIDINHEGELDIESEIYEEKMFLNDNAKYFAENSLSFSPSFKNIEDFQPQVLRPGWKWYKKDKIKDIEKVTAGSSQYFHDDVTTYKYVYPSLGKRMKTVLSYREIYKQPRMFGSFYFADYIPIVSSEFIVKAPKSLHLKYNLLGRDTDKIQFTKEEKWGKVIYKWQMRDVKKVQSESNAPDLSFYAPHIICYVESYQANGKKHHLLGTVKDLYNWYYTFIEEINDQSSDEELNTVVDSLIEGTESELEKVRKIYYWVQDNIKYIAIEDGMSGFIPTRASKVCERKYGDCKDMSSIIHEMLRIADIDGHLSWVGTRDIPYSYKKVPTVFTDNHMICTYKNNGSYYFLDATNKYHPLELPTSFIQGKETLVSIDKSNYELVEIPVIPPNRNAFVDSVWISYKDGKIIGQGKATITGYYRIAITRNLLNSDEKEKRKYLEAFLAKGNNKCFIDSTDITNLSQRDKPLVIKYQFHIADYALSHNDEIYINAHLDRSYNDALIDTSQYELDKEEDFKHEIKSVTILNVPNGYQPTFIPDQSSWEDEAFSYSVDYKTNNGNVIMNNHIVIDYLLLENEKFTVWNNMIKSLQEAYNQVVTLKKQ